ncbi:GNAT family N-acetyltransferase [Rhizobium sp. C1]|uniref:GNAT family N-acetyltransferase n=1 Tax=Rhizobium sp. C1 TaxID=1349799 RepID=UPI001E398A49|nr:GNAT family N-acetyltransferase [Rhizobium sp. C1]MCD2179542.1 acetyltransferase [Rhizobium sp. C1]
MLVTPIKHAVHEGSAPYRCFTADPGASIHVTRKGALLAAEDGRGNRLEAELAKGVLSARTSNHELADGECRRFLSALLGFVFSTEPEAERLELAGDGWQPTSTDLTAIGGHVSGGALSVRADMFWQVARLWTPAPALNYPRHEVFDGRTVHPLRPPKPEGRVYARFIPWLGGDIALDVATLEDLADIHRWMNLPRVDEFWHEAGDLTHHRRYLAGMIADPHVIPLIARFDGRSFGYFEVYWAKEDIVGGFCGAGDYDRGCHVIIGEDACRGRSWFTAWLPSLLHFMFLDEPRTERIVQEPDARHSRQLRNLQRSGFWLSATVDLPGKRAAIVEISRRKFFGARLWHPVDDDRKEP